VTGRLQGTQCSSLRVSWPAWPTFRRACTAHRKRFFADSSSGCFTAPLRSSTWPQPRFRRRCTAIRHRGGRRFDVALPRVAPIPPRRLPVSSLEFRTIAPRSARPASMPPENPRVCGRIPFAAKSQGGRPWPSRAPWRNSVTSASGGKADFGTACSQPALVERKKDFSFSDVPLRSMAGRLCRTGSFR
jgi:hypothetical protein